jgi:hypothetical protein
MSDCLGWIKGPAWDLTGTYLFLQGRIKGDVALLQETD